MNPNPIITSILDVDFYKLTMMQLVFHRYPQVYVKYKFYNRSKDIDLVPYLNLIEQEVKYLGKLKMTDDERDFLYTIPELSKDFVDFLYNFRLNPDNVHISIIDNKLNIDISGLWLHTILFETMILGIITELHTTVKTLNMSNDWKTKGLQKLDEKIQMIKKYEYCDEFKFVEFGTRRRATKEWHEIVFRYMKEQLNDLGSGNMLGTSNVLLSMKYGMMPRGTFAHELVMAHQCLAPLYKFQEVTLDIWNEEYDGKLSIALMDTINTDVFLEHFTYRYANAWKGVRQDSGDAYIIGEKVVNHYKKLGINPLTKSIMFSDNLNIPKALDLHKTFKDKIIPVFGIGTNLTFDLDHIKPCSIVIKVVECNGFPVAKISDEPMKNTTTNDRYLNYLKSIYGIEE